MIAYADVAEEIRRSDNRRPDQIQKQIALTDRWLWTLEELNEHGERASGEQRDNLQRFAFETFGNMDYAISESGSKRQLLSQLSLEPSDMLDLVFDLQDRLFVEGGYRVEGLEEEAL